MKNRWEQMIDGWLGERANKMLADAQKAARAYTVEGPMKAACQRFARVLAAAAGVIGMEYGFCADGHGELPHGVAPPGIEAEQLEDGMVFISIRQGVPGIYLRPDEAMRAALSIALAATAKVIA